MPGKDREVPTEARRLDPREALASDPLSAPFLEADGGRTSAIAHIRARDPRARLEAASAELHGHARELPPLEHEAEEAPRRAPKGLGDLTR